MDEDRIADSLRDELAREIERAFEIEPAPSLKVQVRARIDRERVRQAWWRPGRLVSIGAGALALAIVAVLAVFRAGPAPETGLRTPRAVAIPPVPPPQPFVADGQARSGEERPVRLSSPVAPRHPTVRIAARVEPQVLIPPDEAGALRRLAANIREGKIDPSVLDDIRPSAAPSEALREIAIQPITIQPITIQPITIGPLARLENLEGGR